jgi:hypothetical protein
MASELDPAQILKRLYDDATNRLSTDAEISGSVTIESAQEVVISHVDDSIKIGDGTDLLAVNTNGSINAAQSGTWNITNVSGTVSLPTGASTESTLSALNTKVTACDTGAVVVSSSALPSGAATEATLNAQSSFDHGSKGSIGLTALQLTASSITAKKGVLVKASAANTGIIYVGNSDVTANSTEATDGYELYAGEAVLIEVDNANKIYVIASATGQKVFFTVS